MTLFGYTFSTTELLFLTLAAGWLFSALSYSLPAPTEKSSVRYVFVYRLCHFAAANLDRFKAQKPEA